MSGRKFDDATEAALVARYMTGETMDQISGDFGCSRKTVLDIARRRGVPIRAAGGHHGTGPRTRRDPCDTPLVRLDHLSPHRTRAERQAAQLAGYFASEVRR